MADSPEFENLLAAHRKEKKDLIAQTQKMKHGIPKGDKKKKKEINTEVAEMLAALELKHDKEIQEFQCPVKPPPGISEELGLANKTILPSEKLGQESTSKESTQLESREYANEQSNTLAVPRISKAQKRRNKKAANERERNENIAAQELENLTGLRQLESDGIEKKLLKRNLEIYEVPSDGNCLYKAVEHQLSFLNLQKLNFQTLRELTSKYMLSHMDDFIPFLTNPDTGDVLNEEQYKKYCEDIVSSCTWGGHTEIQALSYVCDVPIEVIQAEGPSIFAGDESCNPKLILSYHRHFYGLGEHYNSVVPKGK